MHFFQTYSSYISKPRKLILCIYWGAYQRTQLNKGESLGTIQDVNLLKTWILREFYLRAWTQQNLKPIKKTLYSRMCFWSGAFGSDASTHPHKWAGSVLPTELHFCKKKHWGCRGLGPTKSENVISQPKMPGPFCRVFQPKKPWFGVGPPLFNKKKHWEQNLKTAQNNILGLFIYNLRLLCTMGLIFMFLYEKNERKSFVWYLQHGVFEAKFETTQDEQTWWKISVFRM